MARVAPAFAEYVLENHDYGSDPLESFATGLSDLPGTLAAPGLYLRALNAEREGNSLLAEADLESAVLADPEFGPSLAELAWYAAMSSAGLGVAISLTALLISH